MTVAIVEGASTAACCKLATRLAIVREISPLRTRHWETISRKSGPSSRISRAGSVASRLARAGAPSSNGTSPK